MKRPLSGVTIMFAAGILADSMLSATIPAELFWWATIALLAVFVAAYRTRWSVPVLMAAVMFCGAWLHRDTTRVVPAHHLSRLIAAETDLITVRGVIDTDPQLVKGDTSYRRWRFILRCTELDRGNDWEPVTGNVMMSLGADREFDWPLQYGDLIELFGIEPWKTTVLNKAMNYTVRSAGAEVPLQAEWADSIWAQAETLEVAHFRPEGSDHRPKTSDRMLYNAQGLYGIFHVEDRYVRCVRTQYHDPVWKDSCVEFFAQPRPDRGYFNFEFNCGGAFLCLHITNPERTPDGFKEYIKVPVVDWADDPGPIIAAAAH